MLTPTEYLARATRYKIAAQDIDSPSLRALLLEIAEVYLVLAESSALLKQSEHLLTSRHRLSAT
jgi:hypothetical protein